jgi:hypothetical protein
MPPHKYINFLGRKSEHARIELHGSTLRLKLIANLGR